MQEFPAQETTELSIIIIFMIQEGLASNLKVQAAVIQK